MKKILGYAGLYGSAIVAASYAGIALAAPLSTATLGTSIDTVSETTLDYFTVLIAKFWPFLLGAVILVGVVVFGKRIIHSMFGK